MICRSVRKNAFVMNQGIRRHNHLIDCSAVRHQRLCC